MSAAIIDGKAFAERPARARRRGRSGLRRAAPAARPASPSCWSARIRRARSMSAPRARRRSRPGWQSFEHRLADDDVARTSCSTWSRALNADERVDGILVQLPLPAQIDEKAVIAAIDPDKDVDGFHVDNVGRLAVGEDGLVPCTPLGCLMLLKDRLGDLAGLEAVVVGRSNIVGKPMAQLLLRENCTVTIAHSRTRDLPERRAPRRHRRRRGRPAGDGQGRLAEARRDGDRRRHQPRVDGKTAGRRRRFRRARARSPARSRRCRAGSAR